MAGSSRRSAETDIEELTTSRARTCERGEHPRGGDRHHGALCMRALRTIRRFGAGSARRADGSPDRRRDRKSTRLNSSHVAISYAVFCLKKKKTEAEGRTPVEWIYLADAVS